MKKQKSHKKGGFTDEEIKDLKKFDEQNAERAFKRREKEIQIVNIVGGILGIATLIFAGFAYGIELPIILFLVVLSNNLCNVK